MKKNMWGGGSANMDCPAIVKVPVLWFFHSFPCFPLVFRAFRVICSFPYSFQGFPCFPWVGVLSKAAQCVITLYKP